MKSLPSFERGRVLVVGDVMLDRYWHGDTQRISPEAPVPVVRVGREEQRLGGAANVAVNLACLGLKVSLLGVVGEDALADTMRQLLADAGVDAHFVTSSSHPTIDKLRVLSNNQQLIRLDAEQDFSVTGAFDLQELHAQFQALLDKADVVVCSDYDKGTLYDAHTLIGWARNQDKPVLVDPKGTDWQRYQNATLITPNVSEFVSVGGTYHSEEELTLRAQKLRRQLQLEALLITRSEAGMTLYTQAGRVHQSTQAREVFDVTGAGDTVVALLAAGLAAGQTLAEAMQLANLGAGIAVGKQGTATVSVDELRRELRTRQQSAQGVVDEDHLQTLIAEARTHGEKVVMTNGCFDLLHPGHIAYLEEARALGDYLVVAVNSDASVSRLKGPQRPINSVEHRMQVLQGLAAVDWVVPFSEDTPARLIAKLQPDILVKGGDYRPEEVAGAESVLASGGEVKILQFLDGYSSSAIIERMQQD